MAFGCIVEQNLALDHSNLNDYFAHVPFNILSDREVYTEHTEKLPESDEIPN